ncbi:MAG: C-terminal binding protein [Chloroflexota bacterium]|nr:C-terminal binding protein [Chloroflexota bacterium]MDE2918391.1 C-terminal binding protein [Chloroflexota bacterium]
MADPPTVFVPLQHAHRFLPYVGVVEQAGGQVDFVDIQDTEKRRAALARATAGAVGLDPFGADDFAIAPHLRAIITCTTGVDPIDLAAATEHGVMVGNTPDLCIEEVADHTLMLLLSCYRRLPRTVYEARSQAPTREGAIDVSDHWPRLRDQVAGLLGFGNIARAVATRCQAFGLRVIACDPYVNPSLAEELNVELVDFDEVLATADYLCVHLPLNPETRHCLNAEAFERMKPTAFVINTARGPIIDEPALVAALQTGQIAGAGLDVTEIEPIAEDNPLLDIPDALLTPHSAGYSQEASRWGPESALRCAAAVIQGGCPRSIQNPAVLERLKA